MKYRVLTTFDREPVNTPGGGEKVTKESFAKEANINVIMAKWLAGQPPVMRPETARYGDFASASDFQDAMNAVSAVQADFEALPAEVRAHFENDPMQVIELLDLASSDPEAYDEAVDLGLIHPGADDLINPSPQKLNTQNAPSGPHPAGESTPGSLTTSEGETPHEDPILPDRQGRGEAHSVADAR